MLFQRVVLRPLFCLIILVSYLVLLCNYVSCVIPAEPVTCSAGNSDCTITNNYGSFPDRSTCHAADLVYPENEDQLISYVRDAVRSERKIKVVTRYGHSIPKLVCPDGDEGLVISTRNLSKVININITDETMTVESGMTLQQLIDEAAKVNLALPNSPYFSGVTIGGMLGTGAHGSSIWGRGSGVHDYVVGIKIISPGEVEDDYIKVRVLSEGDEDLDAAKVSLGVLGVISQVTFKLDPLFKRNITYESREDEDLETKVQTFGNEHEFADMLWIPTQQRAIYRIDDRVPTTTPGDGVFDRTAFRPIPSFLLESSRRTEEIIESNGCTTLKCVAANTVSSAYVASAFGLMNSDFLFTGYPVIGYQNKIQASANCLEDRRRVIDGYCGWDPRVDGPKSINNAFTISMSKVPSFIEDIKELVTLEPQALCSIEFYSGLLMRYIKASSAYLGKDEDGMDFDITFYQPNDPLGDRLNEHILEEIEQMAVFKYGGTPHWGKNRNVAFEGVINKYKDGEKFIRVKERYDPLGLFSSEWTDQVLGLKQGLIKNITGCARAGLCRCNTDDDCGDEYNCVNGLVYKEARVCKKERTNIFSDFCLIDIIT